MSGTSHYRHTVIRASAGTGKTYQLALRFIGLLADGVRPEEILATTFTRKAAGEILDRVLHWLATAASDDAERKKLAQAMGLKTLSRDTCRQLLIDTLRSLHRLKVGTLDSHFIQVATSFGQELGLPPGWTICDELADAMLRDEAIELTLAHDRLSDLLALVHALTKGATSRSVNQLVQGTVSSLFELYRETEPAAWEQLKSCKGLSDEELEQTLAELEGMSLAGNQMAKALGSDVAKARAGAWDDFISKGLAATVLCGEREYNRKPLPPELVALYEKLLRQAESYLVGLIARQTEATYQLLKRYAEHYHTLQLEERVLRFGDVTFRLATGTAAAPELLGYRLDGHIRHILLDEFQDTAPSQWQVLRPLAQGVIREHSGSFFCVGDAKQAIYGWRGGVAEIFDALDGELGKLHHENLARSYRSSRPVIDAVNAVFQNLTRHPNLDKLAPAVAAWQATYPEHSTEKSSLAGYVSLEVGPEPTDGKEPVDALFNYTADRVADLVRHAPRLSVGVLVRTNAAVARLIYLLRERGIPASEEGGNPLIDSPAVELILSLLRLADHPGDRVARFHLASSPLAGSLEFADYRDDAAAARLGQQLRRQLLDDGYGATIDAWARRLAAECDPRDQSRLQQLIELAYDYQPQSTLRTDDFRRLVQQKRVADPTSSDVRVMTIHQAKGLEFDAVLLPELNGGLVGQRDLFVAGRPSPTEPASVVCRYASEQVRRFFPPALQKLFDDDTRREVTESLCVLYVAMTRAVHSLVMLVPPAKANERSMPKTYAGLLRATLAPGKPATAGQTLFEHGDASWLDKLPHDKLAHPAPALATDDAPLAIRLAPPVAARSRGLERTSPSALEGGMRLRAAHVLAPKSSAAFGLGSLVHAWMEQVAWLDDGLPGDDVLHQIAVRMRSEVGDVVDDLGRLLPRFRQQLAAPAVAAVICRAFYDKPANLGLAAVPADAWSAGSIELALSRERAFAVRQEETLLTGSIDRLVIVRHRGKPIAADVVDFKTDVLPAGDAALLASKIAFYRPQMEAYRAAAAKLLHLDESHIATRLVFLDAGIVAPCSA